MYDNMIFIPEKRWFIVFSEGTGDNLLPEDYDAGYVDYINYDVLIAGLDAYGDPSYGQYDGGMVLLSKPYGNYSLEQIIYFVMDMAGCAECKHEICEGRVTGEW